MNGKKSKWIWHYGDYELYHSLKLHSKRQEYDYMFPPFWRLDDCYHSVKFKGQIELATEDTITVLAKGVGHVEVDGKRHPFATPILLGAGSHTVVVFVLNQTGLPCAYVSGDRVTSDESWTSCHYGKEWTPVGCNDAYTAPTADPQVFPFAYTPIDPVAITSCQGGTLYDFGRETFATLCFEQIDVPLSLYYGESPQEALDTQHAYLRDAVTPFQAGQPLPARAFRYVFIPDAEAGQFRFTANFEYLPLQRRGAFRCSHDQLNQIWNSAADTFHLNSREFFLDGIKRDRWVWSGDAYQSHLINRYLFLDGDISRRTMLALRGKDPVETHINTILDYSFYWIMSVYDYYQTTADAAFVRFIYPRLKSLMDFCLSRLDEDGFAQQVGFDWIFIDWADMDKTGAVCAEQLLLWKSLHAMTMCCHLLGEDATIYQQAAQRLDHTISQYFWDAEKGGFVDSFASGNRSITRHANLFALLFGYGSEAQRVSIVENVLQNDVIPHIKTPYFKFYELEAMCVLGELTQVTHQMLSYWGGMVSMGATTFWEEFDPELQPAQQLHMYQDKYGKSLCHAWGASPIYLIGKYYLGVAPTAPGYQTFDVRPNLGGLDWMEGTVPVGDGTVSIQVREGMLRVQATKSGGTVYHQNKRYPLEKDVPLQIPYDK